MSGRKVTDKTGMFMISGAYKKYCDW